MSGDDEYTYSNITFTVAVLLVFTTSVINGLFVGVRKNLVGNLDTITFLLYFTLGSFLFALPLYLAEGLNAPESSLFSTENIAAIFFAGLTMHLGDYLCFAAASKLHSGTIMALTNLPLVFLPIGEYYIYSEGVEIEWLWISVVLMVVGLLVITGAEFPQYLILLAHGEASEAKAEAIDDAQEESQSLLVKPRKTSDVSSEYWLVIGTAAGLLGCAWPLLDDYAEVGDGSVRNPAIVLFIFICGEIGALPIVFFIEQFDLLGIAERRPNETIWGNLAAAGVADSAASFSLGALCSAAYAAYFYSISELPVPMAYSIYLLEVPIAAIAGVALFGEYHKYDVDRFLFAMLFIFVGIVLYGAAIYVLLEDAYSY